MNETEFVTCSRLRRQKRRETIVFGIMVAKVYQGFTIHGLISLSMSSDSVAMAGFLNSATRS